MYVHAVLYWGCVESHVHYGWEGWQCFETSLLLTTAVLLPVFWTSDNKPMCLSWMIGTPHQQCCGWVDDHRKYAKRVSVIVWGIIGCGQTMGLLSLAYVHILVVNNQTLPHLVCNIIQNYRCRIKRKCV
jgi:hypothetical protein